MEQTKKNILHAWILNMRWLARISWWFYLENEGTQSYVQLGSSVEMDTLPYNIHACMLLNRIDAYVLWLYNTFNVLGRRKTKLSTVAPPLIFDAKKIFRYLFMISTNAIWLLEIGLQARTYTTRIPCGTTTMEARLSFSPMQGFDGVFSLWWFLRRAS